MCAHGKSDLTQYEWLLFFHCVESRDSLPQALIKIFNFNNLLVPCAIAQYAVFELDLATNSCFLLFHDTNLPPTKIQYPVVDLWSDFEPAQSLLLKFIYSNDQDMYKALLSLETLLDISKDYELHAIS